MLVISAGAHAVPIQLPTDQVTKMKYTNFENFIEQNQTPGVQAGDAVAGILQLTSVGTIGQPNLLNGQLVTKEITGQFHLTIVGGSVATNHLDFGLTGPGDFLRLYVGQGATYNWDPTNIATATDGNLWLEVNASTFYEGVGDITGPASGETFNKNWANFSVNNSGYWFTPQFFGALTGDPTAHTYLGPVHGDHLVDTLFNSRLFVPSGVSGWAFRSEDPMYVWATIPEPGTLGLLGAGLLGIGLAYRRRKKS